jgi:hypothetical protein
MADSRRGPHGIIVKYTGCIKKIEQILNRSQLRKGARANLTRKYIAMSLHGLSWIV